ncbi:MAG: hypothetical protein MJ249_16910, partial [Kiritimatiellae bacterium]|nr:hypothetical protein [Kiritimatiellia bacterium]
LSMNKIALGIAAALTTASAVGGGIEGIISSVSSSGYYKLTPPENAFFSASNTYWMAHEAFNKSHEYFIQADLTTPYRPLSYSINVEGVNDANRKAKCFELWGWPENGSAWVVLDRRVDVRWESGETERVFYINPPENYTKLRLEMLSPMGSSNYAFCINLLSFDDAEPASADVYNLVRTAKLNASGSPFVLGSCEVESGSVDNLFDESYSVDFIEGLAQNGNWMIRKDGDGRFVTLTFSEDAFAGGTCMLTGYELSMCIGGASIVASAQNRVPVAWQVYVSGSADPGENDWTLVDTRNAVTWTGSGFELGGYRVWHLSFSPAIIGVARSVKFRFDTPRSDKSFIQLGEIGLFGKIIPPASDPQGYEIASASINSVGQRGVSATLSIVPRTDIETGYDLFADLEHDGRAETRKVLADATASGIISVDIGQLKHGSSYILRFRVVSREGIESVGDDLAFATPDDIQADDLPAGYQMLEYVESTSGGGQYVDLGFIPSGSLGFDCDLIIYNAVTKNNEWDGTTNHFGSAFGVEDGSAPLALTTSSGNGGGYTRGLYFYKGSANSARLTPRERLQVSHRAGMYSVVCGSVTNTASINNAEIFNGKTKLCAFASAGTSGPLYNSTTRFYSLRFYDEANETLTHGFVPARGPGDVLGFYDTVTDTWCPNLGQVPLVGGGVRPGGRLTTESIDFTTGRRISVCLSRKSQNAAEVFAVYGSECGGIDREAWACERKCGTSFAAGETRSVFSVQKIPPEAAYLRFYTANGEWSQTIYLPDLPRKSVGFAIILK